jgi:hypothetical protein
LLDGNIIENIISDERKIVIYLFFFKKKIVVSSTLRQRLQHIIYYRVCVTQPSENDTDEKLN